MNPKAQRTILRQSRIFGYTGAVLSIPFALAGGFIASCCPFGVLVGAAPLMITSGIGAVLAALFLDYSVVSKKDATGAGLRVGMRTATIAALAGGIITLFTASQSLTMMSAAAASQYGNNEGGVAAAFMLGFTNLLMLLIVVALCLPAGILWGVIGAAIRGSAALDQEPPPVPGWEAEVKALKKGSLIEWGVLLGLLAACAIVIPMIQQHSIAGNHPAGRQYDPTDVPTYSIRPKVEASPSMPNADNGPHAVSEDGVFSVEMVGDDMDNRQIQIGKKGTPIMKVPAMGYLQVVHWSPGNKYAAINERRGNCGDYLWIVNLQDKTILKQPDDNLCDEMESRGLGILEPEAKRQWGQNTQVDRYWLIADGWESPEVLSAIFAVRFFPQHAQQQETRLECRLRLKVSERSVEILDLKSTTAPDEAASRNAQDSISAANSKLIIGKWLERKFVIFNPDGTWGLQRHEEAPIDYEGRRWSISGDQLTLSWPGGTVVETIENLDRHELRLRDASGHVSRYEWVSAVHESQSPKQGEPRRIGQAGAGTVDKDSRNANSFPGEKFPITRQRLIQPAELDSWTEGQLRYAINEMFARHGANFGKDEIRRVFEQVSWYRARPGVDFDEIENYEFSEIEKANLKTLGAARDAAQKR